MKVYYSAPYQFRVFIEMILGFYGKQEWNFIEFSSIIAKVQGFLEGDSMRK